MIIFRLVTLYLFQYNGFFVVCDGLVLLILQFLDSTLKRIDSLYNLDQFALKLFSLFLHLKFSLFFQLT